LKEKKNSHVHMGFDMVGEPSHVDHVHWLPAILAAVR
jgi:hypothetical protein